MSNLTTKAIKESFFTLLSKKSIDQITVRDITTLCGVSRNTFYYHYEDITALLEEMMTEMVDELIEKYPSIASLEQGVEVAVEFVLQIKTAAMHVYNSDRRFIYERSLMRLCRHVSKTMVTSAVPEGKVTDEERELLINYYKCMCFGFIIDWCDNGLKPGYAENFKKLIELRKNLFGFLLEDLSE